jgi:hypothetical protein
MEVFPSGNMNMDQSTSLVNVNIQPNKGEAGLARDAEAI